MLIIPAIFMASCRREKNTVERLPLSGDERQIAVLTSDILEKFKFEKDKAYDINIYFYENGSIENNGGVSGINTDGEDGTVLISGRKEGNVGFAWNISTSGAVVKLPAAVIDDDKLFMTVNGIGQEKFMMEEHKEYVLVFAAYKEGNELPASFTEPFYEWDAIENKAGALTEFSYAYIITVKLSDLPE